MLSFLQCYLRRLRYDDQAGQAALVFAQPIALVGSLVEPVETNEPTNYRTTRLRFVCRCVKKAQHCLFLLLRRHSAGVE
ncbi:MAG: hypothetical protein DYG89_40275 [Caldilinea sp. CFX5]|nr:hypothetical protein [Caldilinea sp. CFX5]